MAEAALALSIIALAAAAFAVWCARAACKAALLMQRPQVFIVQGAADRLIAPQQPGWADFDSAGSKAN